jgi:hypothetical protein
MESATSTDVKAVTPKPQNVTAFGIKASKQAMRLK